jgi:hypothetical protein
MKTTAKAAAERVRGGQPSRLSAFVASFTVGLAAATLTYKVLRSGGGEGD